MSATLYSVDSKKEMASVLITSVDKEKVNIKYTVRDAYLSNYFDDPQSKKLNCSLSLTEYGDMSSFIGKS